MALRQAPIKQHPVAHHSGPPLSGPTIPLRRRSTAKGTTALPLGNNYENMPHKTRAPSFTPFEGALQEREERKPVAGSWQSESSDDAAVVEQCYGDVLAYCRRHGPRGSAEDLAQEVFLRFARQSTYRDRGTAKAYLLAIARNLCIDAGRSAGRAPLPVDPSGEEVAAIADPRNPIGDWELSQALAALDAQSREVLELRYDQGLSASEMAQVLEVSRFSAHRRLKRALEQLRQQLLPADSSATEERSPR